MRFLAGLAAKNLFRNKLRSTISIIAIALSVALVVFAKGMVTGMIDNMFSLHIQYQAGHIKIIDQEYQQKKRLLSLNHPVDGFQGEGISKMEDELKQLKGVKEVIPRIRFGAAVSQEEKMVQMMGLGVNPAKEIEFTNLKEQLIDGRMIKAGQREVVLGVDLLNKLDSRLGDKITFLYQTSFGAFKGSTFRIVDKIDSGLKLLDKKVLYLPLSQAQRILEMPDMATEILLETYDYKRVDQVLPQVKDLFETEGSKKKYHLAAWDQGYDIITMLKAAERIYHFIYIFLVLLGSFVVINTMIMIVKERTKEIGMMTALGLKARDVIYIFVLEGLFMGLVGSFLGVILGGTAAKITAVTGIIDYSSALQGVSEGILLNPVLRPEVSGEVLLYSFSLGVIITTITAVIPARKAAKLEPAQALRTKY